MTITEKDLEDLAERIANKVQHKTPPCHLLTEADITTLQDLVDKRKLMGKGFLWLLAVVVGMLAKDIYLLVRDSLHWGV